MTLVDVKDPALKIDSLNLGYVHRKGKITPTNRGNELVDLLKEKGVLVVHSFGTNLFER